MNTEEKINMILENQKSLMKEVGFIEELLKVLLVNNALDSAESLIKTGDSSLNEKIGSLNEVINDLSEKIDSLNDLSEEVDSLDEKINSLSKLRRPYSHEEVAKAENMGAFRVGAAFRLPVGFCEHANGRVWRITKIIGDYVELHRTHGYYYKEFNIADILDYYENV